jgi:hypothetical protein
MGAVVSARATVDDRIGQGENFTGSKLDPVIVDHLRMVA